MAMIVVKYKAPTIEEKNLQTINAGLVHSVGAAVSVAVLCSSVQICTKAKSPRLLKTATRIELIYTTIISTPFPHLIY
jgi:hypothetical protein